MAAAAAMAAVALRRRCRWAIAALVLRTVSALRLHEELSSDHAEARPQGVACWECDEIRAGLLREVAEHVLEFISFRYQVASCSECSSVKLWGPSGSRVSFHSHVSEVIGVRIFPQGDRAVTWATDGLAVVWDVASGAAITRLRGVRPIRRVRVFPQGDRVVTRDDVGGCMIWDAMSGLPLRAFGQHWSVRVFAVVGDVDVFPAGDRVLIWGREVDAAIWDAEMGVFACALRGHNSSISTARIFPDGGKVVTAGFDFRAIVWDVATCSPMFEFYHADGLTDVAVLSNGEAVATVSSFGWTRIWSASFGESLRTLVEVPPLGMQRAIGIEAFPSDIRVATYNIEEAIIWNSLSGEQLHRLVSRPSRTQDIAISSDGRIVVTCGGNQVIVWDAGAGARLFTQVDAGARHDDPRSCFVEVLLGNAVDENGFGRGLSWREVRRLLAGCAGVR